MLVSAHECCSLGVHHRRRNSVADPSIVGVFHRPVKEDIVMNDLVYVYTVEGLILVVVFILVWIKEDK
jgi:hypothetical protein